VTAITVLPIVSDLPKCLDNIFWVKEIDMFTDSQTIKDVIGLLSAKSEFEGKRNP